MVVILPGWNTGSIDVYIPLRSADEPNLLPPVWWKSSASTTPMWRLNASEWTLLMALWQSPQQIQARLPQRGSPIIYVTEPTLSDHGRHRHVWLCTLQGSDWCNLLKCNFSVVSTQKEAAKNDPYFRNLFYMFLFHCINSPCSCALRIWLFIPRMLREK